MKPQLCEVEITKTSSALGQTNANPWIVQCAVPENIHSHPTEDHWKFQGGGGSQKLKFLKESMKLNWNFWRGKGRQGSNQKNLCGGRVRRDIWPAGEGNILSTGTSRCINLAAYMSQDYFKLQFFGSIFVDSTVKGERIT